MLRLETAQLRLSPRRALGAVHNRMRALDERAESLVRRIMDALAGYQQRVGMARATLTGVDPEATLRRGFALLWTDDRQQLITRVAQASAGSRVAAELADGFVLGTVDRVERKEEEE